MKIILLFAAIVIAAPNVPHRVISVDKSTVKKNTYPCKVCGDTFIHVHETDGTSTMYDVVPPRHRLIWLF